MVIRSSDEWTVAYFVARCGGLGRGGAPPQLDVGTWKESYELFWRKLNQGRTVDTFRNSLKNARDSFDSHIHGGRIGWRDEGPDRDPKKLPELALDVWTQWSARSDEELFEFVSGMITRGLLLPDDSVEDADFQETPSNDPDERVMRSIRVRRGGKAFRKMLLSAYERRCAITNDGPADVLEAAHIWSHAESGVNALENGILLRADIHTLFDLKLIWIDVEDYTVELDELLIGSSYEQFGGKYLRTTKDGNMPSAAFLKKHQP